MAADKSNQTWAGGADEPGKHESSLHSADFSFASHFVAPCLTLRALAKLGLLLGDLNIEPCAPTLFMKNTIWHNYISSIWTALC